MTQKAAQITVGQRIMTAARAVISGRLAVQRKPGYCLMLTRQVVESALGFSDGGFYRRFIVVKADPKHEGYWARDAQKSLRAQKFNVRLDALLPGDLLFNDRVSKPYGHVGIYIGAYTYTNSQGRKVTIDGVLENTDSRRGVRLGGAVAVTPLELWQPTEAFRIPDHEIRGVK